MRILKVIAVPAYLFLSFLCLLLTVLIYVATKICTLFPVCASYVPFFLSVY